MQNRMSSFFKKTLKNMKIVELSLSAIRMGKYQKKLNKERVATIVANFDPDRMRPIDVSFRDGFFWCFDGQHRVEAYRQMGMETIPAIIHEGLSYEDEALLFARQQDNVGTVQAHHKWNALVEAKDPATLKTIDIAKKYGFTIGFGESKKGKIVAIKTVQDAVCQFGFDGFETILQVISEAWTEIKDGSRSILDKAGSVEILDGLFTLFVSYGNNPTFSVSRLTEVLGLDKPSNIIRDSKNYVMGNRGQRVAKVILNRYNKRIRNGRLPDLFSVL